MKLPRGLVKDPAIQPDHVSVVVVRDRGAIVIAGRSLMESEMPVNDGTRMVGIRLVGVLRRESRPDRHDGHQEQAGNCAMN